MTTVKELIEFLQKLPEETVIQHLKYQDGLYGGGYVTIKDTTLPEVNVSEDGSYKYLTGSNDLDFSDALTNKEGVRYPPTLTFGET